MLLNLYVCCQYTNIYVQTYMHTHKHTYVQTYMTIEMPLSNEDTQNHSSAMETRISIVSVLLLLTYFNFHNAACLAVNTRFVGPKIFLKYITHVIMLKYRAHALILFYFVLAVLFLVGLIHMCNDSRWCFSIDAFWWPKQVKEKKPKSLISFSLCLSFVFWNSLIFLLSINSSFWP